MSDEMKTCTTGTIIGNGAGGSGGSIGTVRFMRSRAMSPTEIRVLAALDEEIRAWSSYQERNKTQKLTESYLIGLNFCRRQLLEICTHEEIGAPHD